MRNSPIILESMEQGSKAWFEARIGRVTASKVQALFTGGRGLTRLAYIIDVASEIVSGMPAESVSTWGMQRGIILEPYAGRAYSELTGREFRSVGLGYLDKDRRISASPDGLMSDRGLEIKCQGAKAHIRTVIDAKSPEKFMKQMQTGMWVFGVDTWDYVSYCPEFKAMPLFVHTVQRDDEMIKRIEEACHLAIEEIDALVAEMRLNPRSAAVDAIGAEAIETIEVLQGVEIEIE